jgi:hypothetical protein
MPPRLQRIKKVAPRYAMIRHAEKSSAIYLIKFPDAENRPT